MSTGMLSLVSRLTGVTCPFRQTQLVVVSHAGTYRGQPAALKLLILDEESAAAILNEVRLCLKLNHRNLVRLLDCAVVSTSSRQFSTTSSLVSSRAQLQPLLGHCVQFAAGGCRAGSSIVA